MTQREQNPAATAFDDLHSRHAAGLTRQAYLLTGRPELARRAVARGFRLAWQRWPQVAVDPDPAGWVRAAVYECALTPWQRLLPWLRTARTAQELPSSVGPADRALLTAVLGLPAPYRRMLVLHDGVGLGLYEAATEVEASTPAAAGRLAHARELVVAELTRGEPSRAELTRGETRGEKGGVDPAEDEVGGHDVGGRDVGGRELNGAMLDGAVRDGGAGASGPGEVVRVRLAALAASLEVAPSAAPQGAAARAATPAAATPAAATPSAATPPAATPPAAASLLRAESERSACRLTRVTFALTGLFALVTLSVAVVAPDRGAPPWQRPLVTAPAASDAPVQPREARLLPEAR
ncbi:RNA polymerase sigma factor [Streptomyces lydicus]|uniref:RNA polymerase sigma factor n=1 Tax=Streptomyces lydicus TaxID=47763 RepID=UPI0036FB6F5D